MAGDIASHAVSAVGKAADKATKRGEFWVNVATKLGVPTCFAFALLYGIWEGSIWVANEVVIPIKDRHFRFVDTVETSVKEQTGSTLRTEKVLESLLENQQEIKDNGAKNSETAKQQASDIKELLRVVKGKPEDPMRP